MVSSERHTRSWARTLVVTLLAMVASIAIGAYVVVHWAERQILDTDNWVALVSPLPKQPTVSSALGTYISDQVFSAVPVKNKIADALPPQAAFLAGPLTDQLRVLTTKASQKIVASDGFQAIWGGANRLAMNRLVAEARGQTPPVEAKLNEKFNIDISSARGQLRSALGTASEAIPALQPAADKVVKLSADLQARPRRVQQLVRTTDYLAAVLPWLIAASLLGLLAVSAYRRRTLLTMTMVVVILMLLELIGIKLLRQQVLDRVRNAANLDAVSYAYDALTQWLRHMIYVVIVGMVVLGGLLLLGGPAAWARQFRSYIKIDQLKNTRLLRAWRNVRLWLGRWEYYFWLGAVVLVLVLVAVSNTVNARVVTNAALITVCLFAGLHIIATPPTADRDKALRSP